MVAQVEPEPHADEERIDADALVAAAIEHVTLQAQQHPLRTLGIAFGVGYVLGGGVPRFAVRMALSAGLRQASTAVLTSAAAAQLAQRLLGSLRTPAPEPAPVPTPKNGRARKSGKR